MCCVPSEKLGVHRLENLKLIENFDLPTYNVNLTAFFLILLFFFEISFFILEPPTLVPSTV